MRSSELSIRERRLVRYCLEGWPTTTAMLKAGYSKTTAEKQQKRVLNQPRLQHAIWVAMAENGLTDARLASVMKKGLDACNPDGQPDYAMRHRYLETILKLYGFGPVKKSSAKE